MGTATTRQTFEPTDADWIRFRVKHAKPEISFHRVKLSVLATTGVANDVLKVFAAEGKELTTEELLGVLNRRGQ